MENILVFLDSTFLSQLLAEVSFKVDFHKTEEKPAPLYIKVIIALQK
jgi:hypothetical protein